MSEWIEKKRDWVSIVIVSLLGLALIVRAFHGTMRGEQAPDFNFERYQGEPSKLSALRGKVVMLDFWATWCGPCREELPGLEALAREYESQGVVLLAANQESPDLDEAREAVTQWVTGLDPSMAKYAIFPDPSAREAFQVQALPTLYVIGRDGKIVGNARGLVDKETIRGWVLTALK